MEAKSITDTPDTKPKDNSNRDMAVRTQALDMAIRANCGLHYDEGGRASYDEALLVTAAKAFENFIKGTSTPSPIETKKEAW